MDKRGARILIGCIICTVIVSILFLFAFRISRLSCELVSVEPERLRAAQLEAFNKKRNKPVRSHDKMMLMKINAYLEYNIIKNDNDADNDDADSGDKAPASGTTARSLAPPVAPHNGTGSSRPAAPMAGPSPAGTSSSGVSSGGPNNSSRLPAHPGPSPVLLSPFGTGQPAQATQQPASVQSQGWNASMQPQQQQQRVKKRFLPLELDSIETRNLAPEANGSQQVNRHKYILSFNCTKLNMIFVYQNSRVYVESMSLELKPTSNQKTHCELELAKTGEFEVNAAAASVRTSDLSKDHLARFYCSLPRTFSCRHYSRNGPSSSNGLLLAELHINALEFETATYAAGKADRKHVKSEFKSKRVECR